MIVQMIICLFVLALRQTGRLSRVFPASHPMAAVPASPTLNWISGKTWMDRWSTDILHVTN